MSFYNLFLSLESNYSSATRGLETKIMLYMNFFHKIPFILKRIVPDKIEKLHDH